MLMEAEANGGYGKFFRAVDQETLVGGKRVTKQQVPELPESAATTIHQVKVTLYGSKPPIWRRLELSSMMTLGRLHHVLQAAFSSDGWRTGMISGSTMRRGTAGLQELGGSGTGLRVVKG